MPGAMVFGWKKKQAMETRPQPSGGAGRAVRIDEIAPILEELRRTRRSRLVKEAESTLRDVRAKMDRILEIVDTLEGEKLTEEDTDRHINAIVERGKAQVISVIKKAADIELRVDGYEDVPKASHELARMLKLIGDVLGRQTRVIHIFAKKYAGQLKSTLSDLNAVRDELARSSREHEALEAAVVGILEDISSMRRHRASIRDSSEKIKSMRAKIDSHAKDAESAASMIAKMEAAPEFIARQKIAESAGALDGQRRSLEHAIGESFARISRPLSKYIYVTSMDKKKKAIMQDLLDAPARALAAAGPDEVADILNHVRKAVSSESVSVKDVAKSEEQIDAVGAELKGRYEEISALGRQKADLDSKMREFDSAPLEAERARLAAARNSIDALESRIAEVESDRDASESALPGILKGIGAQLRSATSIAYTLVPDDAK